MNVIIDFASTKYIMLILIYVKISQDLLYDVITSILVIATINWLSLNRGGFELISYIIARIFVVTTFSPFQVTIFWMPVPESNLDASQ